MRVLLTGHVQHDHRRYAPGDVLDMPDAEATRLIDLKVAEALLQDVKATSPEPKPKVGKKARL